MDINRVSKIENFNKHKKQSITIISIFGIVILGFYSIINIILLDWPAAFFEILCVVLILYALYLMHRHANNKDAVNIGIAVLISLGIHNFNTGGFSLTGLFWVFVITTIIFYIKGRQAVPWIVFLNLVILFLSLLSLLGIRQLPYEPITIVTFFVSLNVISVFSYLYNAYITLGLEDLENKSFELEDTLLDLSIEESKTKSFQKENEQLNKKVKELESKIKNPKERTTQS